MGFVIGEIKTVKRRIEFELPTSVGQPAKKADFLAEFVVHDHDTVRERQKYIQEHLTKLSRDLAKAQQDPTYLDVAADLDIDFDAQYLREDLVGLEGIRYAGSKDEVPFSSDLVEHVLADRAARSALIGEWLELNRLGTVKRKN